MGIENKSISRRRFLKYSGAVGMIAGFSGIIPAYALEQHGVVNRSDSQTSPEINLLIRKHAIDIGGRDGTAITVNGSIPGPIVRLKEGEDAVIHVTNELDENKSEDPYKVFAKHKKMGDYYNFRKRTIGDFFGDISEKGFGPTISDRLAWNRMRMSATDIILCDVCIG